MQVMIGILQPLDFLVFGDTRISSISKDLAVWGKIPMIQLSQVDSFVSVYCMVQQCCWDASQIWKQLDSLKHILLWLQDFSRSDDKISYVILKQAPVELTWHRVSGYGLSQWETTLHCNVVSYWLSPYPEWYPWKAMLISSSPKFLCFSWVLYDSGVWYKKGIPGCRWKFLLTFLS